MSTTKTECYTITCDRCGETLDNGDGVEVHFSDEDDAGDQARDAGWTITKDEDVCEECADEEDEVRELSRPGGEE